LDYIYLTATSPGVFRWTFV